MSAPMWAFMEPPFSGRMFNSHASEMGRPGCGEAAIAGGAYAALGRAVAVDGGYRVTGRWPFASGCEHCTWLMGGSVVDGGVARLMLFPAAAVRIVDTWTVAGLRGTGSHDIVV